MSMILGVIYSCSSNEELEEQEYYEYVDIDDILADAEPTPWDNHIEEIPQTNCVKLKVRNVGYHPKVFNDKNPLHLEAASGFGADIIMSDRDAFYYNQPLVEIHSCENYYVDRLTHSYPYLLPEAADLLDEIGLRFREYLDANGGGNYRIKVTSVMRTPKTVKSLRRVNTNASDRSAHQYATTFDISYVKFVYDGGIAPNRTFADLKNLLALILYDLREEGRCYVKYERKQGCFHITVRP